MDKLSRDELLALINSKPKKERKKPDLSEDKKIAMLERLADMRETVKKNREAKKAVDPVLKEKEIDAIFEKKYSSQFDKMNALLTDLNENTKEAVRIKKEKLAKKSEEKVVEPPKPILEPPKAEPPKVVQANSNPPVQPPLLRPSIPINPNIHRKGNTRF
jgi:membrane-associated HD superfamily phosphohydrolase